MVLGESCSCCHCVSLTLLRTCVLTLLVLLIAVHSTGIGILPCSKDCSPLLQIVHFMFNVGLSWFVCDVVML